MTVDAKESARPGIRCLVLFSGGLDSILACRLLQAQGIGVTAVNFVTPFFRYDVLRKADETKERARKNYGIEMEVSDISHAYIDMLRNPPHGFGRYLNPCIDCKILMLRKAGAMLPRYRAGFLATGEVLGQRPMSQRRDAMRIIERESGAEGILLRPLCALHMKETIPEKEGLVDRSRLLGITGRGRKEQIRLARSFGIVDYPAPAGGCRLADPILSRRFRRMMEMWSDMGPEDFLLAGKGRHFLLPDGSWLAVGRDERENIEIESFVRGNDFVIKVYEGRGPTAVWKRVSDMALSGLAAAVVAFHARGERIGLNISGPGPEGPAVPVRPVQADRDLIESLLL